MWNDKNKAITFSFDDGCRRDVDLIKVLDKYALKATFNLNSALLGTHFVRDDNYKISPCEVAGLYRGHEVAAHTLSHPTLTLLPDDKTIVYQVEQDRLDLEKLCGKKVVGFAYPGNGDGEVTDRRVAEILRRDTGVKYARVPISSYSFDLPADLYSLKPTVHIVDKKLFDIAERFLALKAEGPQLFYIWGHGFELDNGDGFDLSVFDRFCALVSGKTDIFYGTNYEVLLDI